VEQCKHKGENKMKVSELIEKLSKIDGNADVLINDKLVDNLLDIKEVEVMEAYDDNFVLLHVDYVVEVSNSKEENVLV
jgi:hypothetical protein